MELKSLFPTLHIGQPMDIKHTLFFIPTICSGSVFAQDTGFGFVKNNPDGQTYLYTTQNISSNEVISVQFPQDGTVACCKLTKTTGGKQQQGDAMDLLNESDMHIYGLDIQYSAPFIGIAVVGKNATGNGVSAVEVKHRFTTNSTTSAPRRNSPTTAVRSCGRPSTAPTGTLRR